MSETHLYSLILPQTDTESRGEIRRHFDPTRGPELNFRGCKTLYEAFRRGKELNPLGPCLGYRAVSTNGMATPYIYCSYTEAVARVDAFCAGLDTLNLVAPTEDNMVLLGLYLRNCPEWVIAEQAIFAISGATVPLYDTLGPESAEYILNQTGLRTIVCTRGELDNLCRVKKSGNCPNLTTAIVVDGIVAEAAAQAEEAGLQLLSFAKVEAVGSHRISTKGHHHRPPSGDDIFTFCYTSGTTGNPKGALLTHTNLISASAGCRDTLTITINDRHISYLPLAHIFERLVMCSVYTDGASIAFFRGDPLLLIEDFQACRPTILPAPPRLLNRIHDKIHAGISAAGGFKKKLFDAAVATKTKNLLAHGQLKHVLYDRLLFNKLKTALGMDQLRVIVSGSAPLSVNVMTFFRIMLGVPVIEGYGQTEGAGATSNAFSDDMKTAGHVGAPSAAMEIVLVDVPEMGYLHTDTDHKGVPCKGRGEIWVRGPNVFVGYYKQPEKTAETFAEGGWMKTGDIGLWTPLGQLQIIDRKKNIFKLAQGEYVAPEKIENVMVQSTLIAQAFVHGDSLQSSLVAIFIPDEEPVRDMLRRSGNESLASAPLSEICQNATFRKLVEADMKKVGEANGLHGFEIPRAFYLDSELMSVDNNLLTPTFKLKRQQAKEKYISKIESMYAKLTGTPKSSFDFSIMMWQSIVTRTTAEAPCERLKATLTYTQEKAPRDLSTVLPVVVEKVNRVLDGVVDVEVEWTGAELHGRVGERFVKSTVTRLASVVASDSLPVSEDSYGRKVTTQCFLVPFTILDTNECTLPPKHPMRHKCPASAMCVNTIGSYECVCPLLSADDSLSPGDTADEGFWAAIKQQERSPWEQSFPSSRSSCPNQASTHDCCPELAHTTEGQKCRARFHCPSDPCGSPDHNECADSAICVRANKPTDLPAYTCQCPEGLMGSGKTCKASDPKPQPMLMFDGETPTELTVKNNYYCGCTKPQIDACSGFPPCKAKHEVCTVGPGNQPQCACKPGFVRHEKYGCVDENPPTLKLRHDPHGDRTLRLKQGDEYREYMVDIVDDNAEEYMRSLKVSYSQPLPPGCLTQVGEFHVNYTVAMPWAKVPFVRVTRRVIIEDIDECRLDPADYERTCPSLIPQCDIAAGAKCVNTYGSYQCSCPANSHGDGFVKNASFVPGVPPPESYKGGTSCVDTSKPVITLQGPNPKVFKICECGGLSGVMSAPSDKGDEDDLQLEQRKLYEDDIKNMVKATAGAELCATPNNPNPKPSDCVRAVDRTYKGDVDLTDRVVVGEPQRKSALQWVVPYNVKDDAGNEAATVWREVVVQEVDLSRVESLIREEVSREKDLEQKAAIERAIREEKLKWEKENRNRRASSSRSCPECPVCNCPDTPRTTKSDCHEYCENVSRSCSLSDESAMYSLLFWMEGFLPSSLAPLLLSVVLGFFVLVALRFVMTLLFNPRAYQVRHYSGYDEVNDDAVLNSPRATSRTPSRQEANNAIVPVMTSDPLRSPLMSPPGFASPPGNNANTQHGQRFPPADSIITPSKTGDGVMSDEFNVPNRTFTDGHDPIWTALDKPDDDSNAAGGGSQQFYNSSFVTTTDDGMLKISTQIGKTKWQRYDIVNKEWKIGQAQFKSGMVQSWEKFCFTGGIVEVDIILPGDPYIGGLWPAVWMLGNLGRATYEASTNNVWPWSYNKCDRDLQQAQKISACNAENHFGMHPFQGRGSTEIDILEVMTGDSHGALPGPDPPISLPYADMTLQLAPGVTKNRPQPGGLPLYNDTVFGNTEYEANTWYQDVEMSGNTSVNPFFYGNFMDETKPGEPVTRSKKQAFQADAVGVNHQLTPAHFKKVHTFRLEWQPGPGGRIDWFSKGHRINATFSMEGDGLGTDWVHAYGIKDDVLNDTMGSQIPIEPSYLIMNTAISSTWGFPWVAPDSTCKKCYDCEDPKCACSLGVGFCKMMRESDVAMYIDSIRVYQSRNASAHVGHEHTLGCDPLDYPTKGWIKGHEDLYMRQIPFSLEDSGPLRNVQKGGGACKTDLDCGSGLRGENFTAIYEKEGLSKVGGSLGHGKCVTSNEFHGMLSKLGTSNKVCICYPGYTGPNCLAQDHIDDTVSAYKQSRSQHLFSSIPKFYYSPFMVIVLGLLFFMAFVVSYHATAKRHTALTQQRASKPSGPVPAPLEDRTITGRSI
eukprot:Nitzschia sp. Nitz4//scaffold76_size158648//60033//68082//NITZ4_002544-RA/size158648-processed-gene-0.238-mRNA-1//1//CDS//3329557839//1950//frame0